MKKTIKVKLPFLTSPTTIHVQHIVSSYFEDDELVIYRRYIRSRERWVEEMIYKSELEILLKNERA